jgi:SAM-dependent methyltransferase
MPTGRRPLLQLLAGGAAAFAGLAGGGRGAAAAAASADAAEQVLLDPQWPAAWPFRPDDFSRFDESADTAFYESPRFVTHIDDAAIGALTKYYAAVFPPSGQDDVAVLDICSSWISHYPAGFTAGRISGLGMNAEELKRNPALSDFAVADLNATPVLPYPDNSFDVVTNTVSVDYLNRPLEVFAEIRRVLKPGGCSINSFSNRCFPTKAISLWTSTGDLDHGERHRTSRFPALAAAPRPLPAPAGACPSSPPRRRPASVVWVVGSYFHYAGGFEAPYAKDITASGLLGKRGDPMYVVCARKSA